MSGTGRHSGNGTEGPRGARRRHRARLGRQRLTLALAVPALAVLLASCPTSTALFEQVEAAAGVADDQGTEDDPPPTAGPAAPSGLTATAQSADRIDLSWQNESVNADSIELQRGTGGTYTTIDSDLQADSTSFTDSGLDSETTYDYRLRAIESGVSGDWSSIASATTDELAAPSGLTATAASPTQIDLSWSDDSSFETGFDIERDGTVVDTVGADTTSYSDTGLSLGTDYIYRVRAVDAGGTSQWSSTDSTTTETEYDIGDLGPAGGLIFFDDEDDGTNDYGFRYLEAAPASTEWIGIMWGAANTDINGDDDTVAPELDGVGDGQANTTAIVNALGDNGGTDYAAKLADDLEHNGYSDWFFPSRDELDLMYQNLYQESLGGFAASVYYMSSSEYDDFGAWFQRFSDGNQVNDGPKFISDTNRVRAARAFGDEYDIGDTGPAGGIIFYDDEDDGTDDIVGARYLEAAPASTEWNNIEWGDYGTEIGGDAQLTGIGDGQAATDAVVAHMEGKSITGTAAQLADGLSHGGYTDWFLPTKDELDLMYHNKGAIGGFASGYYWSSSEGSAFSAWDQAFGGGGQTSFDKDSGSRVRAVRAF